MKSALFSNSTNPYPLDLPSKSCTTCTLLIWPNLFHDNITYLEFKLQLLLCRLVVQPTHEKRFLWIWHYSLLTKRIPLCQLLLIHFIILLSSFSRNPFVSLSSGFLLFLLDHFQIRNGEHLCKVHVYVGNWIQRPALFLNGSLQESDVIRFK